MYDLIWKKKVSKNIDANKNTTLGLNLLDFGKVLKIMKKKREMEKDNNNEDIGNKEKEKNDNNNKKIKIL